MSKTLVIRPEDKNLKESYTPKGKFNKKFYKKEMERLQIELIKLQSWVKKYQKKIIILVEGRDEARKTNIIKTLIKHMNPRTTRITIFQKPSDIEKTQWYFQRYLKELPNGGEIVFFDGSWYNRAGPEKVMGLCTDSEYKEFILQVSHLEQMLIESHYLLFKFFINISKEKQKNLYKTHKNESLKHWELSTMDKSSIDLWNEYTQAYEKMFSHTHTPFAPWFIVNSNDKKRAKINIARLFLSQINYENKNDSNICLVADPLIVTHYSDIKSFSEEKIRNNKK